MLALHISPPSLVPAQGPVQSFPVVGLVGVRQTATKPDIAGKRRQREKLATRMGFEPTRAEHNGLAVHRLNLSATSSEVRPV